MGEKAAQSTDNKALAGIAISCPSVAGMAGPDG